MKLNKAQQQALKRLYDRSHDGFESYLRFRHEVFPLIGDSSCAMVPWCGMLVGIESDGHTHT